MDEVEQVCLADAEKDNKEYAIKSQQALELIKTKLAPLRGDFVPFYTTRWPKYDSPHRIQYYIRWCELIHDDENKRFLLLAGQATWSPQDNVVVYCDKAVWYFFIRYSELSGDWITGSDSSLQ